MTLDELPPLVTVAEAAPHLRQSPWSCYQQIKQNRFALPVVRLGRKVFIRRSDLFDLLGVAAERETGLNAQ